MKQWTFITHHAAILLLMANRPRITARDLAQEVGITERAVRIIIKDLELEGYIGKAREGRGVCYTVNLDLPMRHRTQSEKAIGDLLQALVRKGPPLQDNR